MRVHLFIVVAAGLLLAGNEQKQDFAAESGQLIILEKQVWEARKNKDAKTLQGLLRDNYVELATAGPRRMTRDDVLKALDQSRVTEYTLEDEAFVQLNRDAAILTYKLTLKSSPDQTVPLANPAYVSSAWVREGAGWVSVFRQATPLTQESARPQPIKAFEAMLTPNSVRYTYKGTVMLEDVHANLDITLNEGKVSWQTYWATWDPGEAKEISLSFLASGIATIQRIDLSASATMGGKKVLCSATSRRIAAFEAVLTPSSVRYIYKGTTMLEDIHANLDVTLNEAKVPWQTYWATWDPGEVKEISLSFLASGIATIQRMDLFASATMGGKKVLCAVTSRRDAKIPVDLKSVPPTLKLVP
jgi:hypothetical protein